jgi:hypothetical protein
MNRAATTVAPSGNKPPAARVVSSNAMHHASHTSRFARFTFASICALGMLLGGCGGAEIGETCDTGGSADECVEGAICTNDGDGNVCRLVCEVQDDCPMDYSCNGVTGGSTKSCQPDRI